MTTPSPHEPDAPAKPAGPTSAIGASSSGAVGPCGPKEVHGGKRNKSVGGIAGGGSAGGSEGPISLPILSAQASGSAGSHAATNAWQKNNPRIAHSRIGIWRAIALILVHVVMAAHIAQWAYTGMTLSPVEPSESMQTLREGAVNAGFVFFLLALVTTVIFGRFFCGWACHIVALQDLCAWAMMKLGIKPKPFRSRLMIYMPLALALYMFVWPVFHREVLRRFFADDFGRLPTWLGQSDPLPGLHAEFFVTDFWATFPPLVVAIPFFFVVGFAIVYFLGAKGFCTYGCPYGGFFAPLDLAAPGKIRVNDNCNHCGHCTAVCTSNVRVHEEVRDHGMVVDVGCMKCLDCVSVCPNDALRFGMGAPTLIARRRQPRKPTDPVKAEEARLAKARARASREARFDMSRKEEWAIAIVFVAMFLALRGMLNAIPMLMAVGLAAIGAFLVHKSWRCIVDPSVRLQNLQLKLKGKLRPAGYAVLLLTLITIAASIWSGAVRITVYRANELYARITTPLHITTRADYAPVPAELETAQKAIHLYNAGDARNRGGFGWSLSPEERTRLAHLHAVAGDLSASIAILRQMVDAPAPSPRDSLIFQLGDLLRATGQAGENDAAVTALFRDALAKHPDLDQVRAQLVAREINLGTANSAAVTAGWTNPLSERTVRSSTLFGAASTHALLGETDKALALAERAAAEHPKSADDLLTAAAMVAGLGKPDAAKGMVDRAAAIPTNRGGAKAAAAMFYLQHGDPQRAASLAQDAASAAEKLGPHAGRATTLQNAARILLATGQRAPALAIFQKAVEAAGHSAWELQSMGIGIAQIALESNDRELFVIALRALTRARDLLSEAPTIRVDLAQVAYATGDTNTAAAEMQRAAELGADNPTLAQQCSDLLAELGRHNEAARWAAEAAKRQEARKNNTPAPK